MSQQDRVDTRKMTMGVDGGADCRACAAALLGADIMSKDDDNMDSMRTSFVRWSTNPNNQEMADQTAKQHNYDIRQCYGAFESLKCDMQERRRRRRRR